MRPPLKTLTVRPGVCSGKLCLIPLQIIIRVKYNFLMGTNVSNGIANFHIVNTGLNPDMTVKLFISGIPVLQKFRKICFS